MINDPTIDQNPSPWPRVLTMDVPGSSGPLGHDFYAEAMGDFNRSFVPAAKSANESLTLDYGETLQVDPNSIVDVPIIAKENLEVGAISLILNFPSDRLEILGVNLGSDANSPMPYTVSGDELRLGWYSRVPLNLKTGERLLTIKVKLIGSLSKDEIVKFNLASDDLIELADGAYQTILQPLLSMDVISGTALGIVDITSNGRLSLANYPNPFKGTTTFTYTLPFDGKVTLEISDVLGSRVMSLLGEQQTAGSHTYTVDADILTPGVYTATMKLVCPGGAVYTRTIKIVNGH